MGGEGRRRIGGGEEGKRRDRRSGRQRGRMKEGRCEEWNWRRRRGGWE